MPRLTAKQYIAAHTHLRVIWLSDRGTYGYLSAKQQWELHDYLVPSRDLNEEQLLAHRHVVSKKRPSLPQRASRAFRAFAIALQQPPVRIATGLPTGRRHKVVAVGVRAVVRPEIDYRLIAKALLEMSKDSSSGPPGQSVA